MSPRLTVSSVAVQLPAAYDLGVAPFARFCTFADGQRLFAFAGTGLFLIDPKSGDTRQVTPETFHGQMDWLAPE